MTKRILAAVLVPFLICVIVMPAAAAETIKIGLMAPLTGSWASEGQEMKAMLDLLLADPGRASLLGKKIELLAEDDGGDPRSAALAAQRLASRGVVAVVGTYGSSITEAAQPIFKEAKIIQIANGSTAIRLTEKGFPYFFRTCPRDDEQARVAVQAIERLQAKNVAVLHDNTTYAKGLAQEAQTILKTAKIVFFDALTPKESDYSVILSKMKQAKPDLIFYTGYYPEAGMLLRQARALNWKVPFLGGDATNNPDLVKIAGREAASGFHFISAPLPKDLPSRPARQIIAAFAGKYGHAPNSIYAVLAGDAFRVITAAIKEAKATDPDALARHLHTTFRDPDGLTGPIAFNAKGDRVGQVYRLYRVDAKGSFVLQD